MRNWQETKKKPRGEVVQMEDLAPRENVQGAGKLRFGERREDVPQREPNPSGPTRPRA